MKKLYALYLAPTKCKVTIQLVHLPCNTVFFVVSTLITALIVLPWSSIHPQTWWCSSCCSSSLSIRSCTTSCHRIGISKQLLHLESSMEQELVVLDWRSQCSIDSIFAFIWVQVRLLVPLNVYCNFAILHLDTHFITYCRAGRIPKHSLPTPSRIRQLIH